MPDFGQCCSELKKDAVSLADEVLDDMDIADVVAVENLMVACGIAMIVSVGAAALLPAGRKAAAAAKLLGPGASSGSGQG